MSKRKSDNGKVVRISPDVRRFLNNKRLKNESYDGCIRRLHGLESRAGEAQPLHVFYVLLNEGQPEIFAEEAEAKGFAIRLAIRRNRKKTERVIPVQEMP